MWQQQLKTDEEIKDEEKLNSSIEDSATNNQLYQR